MISPTPLKTGDTIGIVASARKISEKELLPAMKVFENWGLKVRYGKSLFKQAHQFSGTDKERTADFQTMLDDPEIRAVICARGGYGSVRILDRLDFSKFIKHPKWIAGFSDITAIHAHIQRNFKVQTLHCMMPVNIVRGKKMAARAEALESMRKALFGEPVSYKIAAHAFNHLGKTEGILTGGNLSVLYSLSGSVSDLDAGNKILFLEDLDEYLYHIDRMMVNLDRAGKLSGIKGLIIGGMTEMKDNKVPFGMTAEEIIAGFAAKYKCPACFGFPSGHIDDNRALIMGRKAELSVSRSFVSLIFR
jgi:muramoyltetrapeptide carboxypeptidase